MRSVRVVFSTSCSALGLGGSPGLAARQVSHPASCVSGGATGHRPLLAPIVLLAAAA